MEFLNPQPEAKGVEQTKELHRRKLGRELTDAEAREALSRVMRYMWALNFMQDVRESGGSRPTEQDRLEPSDEEIATEPGTAPRDTGGEGGARRTRGKGPFGLPRRPG